MVKIENINSEGNGVCRIDNIVVFVPYTVIGETVDVSIVKDKKTYKIGKAENIVEPSENRIAPPCPYYEKCGSCNLLHMTYEEQLKAKYEIVESAISRIGKLDCKINDVVPCPNQFNYRNKGAFPVKQEKMGYYENGSHNIVEIDGCMLLDNAINTLMSALKDFAKKYSYYVKHIVIKATNGKSMVTVVVEKDNKAFHKDLIETLKPYGVTSINVNINKNPRQIMGNKTINIYGDEKISYKIMGNEFLISPQSFTQVNTVQAEALYSYVLENMDLAGKTVIDAYCGTGTISLALAKKAKFVYGVEVVESAIRDANSAKEYNNIHNVSFTCAKCEDFIPKLLQAGEKIDMVCVDPPRAGMDKKVIDSFDENGINKIVYVSCSPQTLARDLSLFAEKGYTIKSVTPFDMFPNTAHVECIAVIER